MKSTPTVVVWGFVSHPRTDIISKPVGQVSLPAVFSAPIRPDIIRMVHTNLSKNHRQPYGVSRTAGHQTSAESWGTGRAKARIPRVSGGGTHRSGQGAFGNMCRGGHMYACTKVWRRWHRKVNLNIKRYAVASALAASAVPALVTARGHRIDNVPELPLVLEDLVESLLTSKNVLAILGAVGANLDAKHAVTSRQIRKGRGKMRNRRYVHRKGPIIVYANDGGIARACRNLVGVDTAHVESLNLLKLAPGGHIGRFIIWTKSAVEALDRIFGSHQTPSELKNGYILPRQSMTNSDLARLINSDEVQSVVKAPKDDHKKKHAPMKKNPLRNRGTMLRLNPYVSKIRDERKGKRVRCSRTATAFYKQLLVESDYQDEGCEVFRTWLGLLNI